MKDQAAEIAKGLTKRQRLDVRRKSQGKSICNSSGKALFAFGIVSSTEHLTDLGRAVASILGEKG